MVTHGLVPLNQEESVGEKTRSDFNLIEIEPTTRCGRGQRFEFSNILCFHLVLPGALRPPKVRAGERGKPTRRRRGALEGSQCRQISVKSRLTQSAQGPAGPASAREYPGQQAAAGAQGSQGRPESSGGRLCLPFRRRARGASLLSSPPPAMRVAAAGVRRRAGRAGGWDSRR